MEDDPFAEFAPAKQDDDPFAEFDNFRAAPAVGTDAVTARGQRGLSPAQQWTDEAVTDDVWKSLASVPRDIYEGTLALPKTVDDFEQWAIQKGKERGGVLGRMATNYEAIDKRIMPSFVRDNLPSQEDIQSATTRMTGIQPYESKTWIGKGLRTGANIAVPVIGPLSKAAKAKELARRAFREVPELDAAAQRAYQAADAAAPQVFPQQYNRMAAEVEQTAQRGAINPTNMPRTHAAVERIQEGVQTPATGTGTARQWYNAFGGTPPPAPKPTGFKEVEELRRGLLKAERRGFNTSDGYWAGEVRRTLDDALDAVGASSPEYKQARAAYRTYKASEALDTLIKNATRRAEKDGKNVNDAIQKALFNKTQDTVTNQKWLSQFPPDVRKMMAEAAMKPKRLEGLIDWMKKDQTLLSGVLSQSWKVATVFKALSMAGKFADKRMSGLTPKMIEELKRSVQGLRPVPKTPIKPLGGALTAGAAGASLTPNENVAPATIPLPTDDDETYYGPAGIRG